MRIGWLTLPLTSFVNEKQKYVSIYSTQTDKCSHQTVNLVANIIYERGDKIKLKSKLNIYSSCWDAGPEPEPTFLLCLSESMEDFNLGCFWLRQDHRVSCHSFHLSVQMKPEPKILFLVGGKMLVAPWSEPENAASGDPGARLSVSVCVSPRQLRLSLESFSAECSWCGQHGDVSFPRRWVGDVIVRDCRPCVAYIQVSIFHICKWKIIVNLSNSAIKWLTIITHHDHHY